MQIRNVPFSLVHSLQLISLSSFLQKTSCYGKGCWCSFILNVIVVTSPCMLYEKHIFICTNQRKPGKRISCGEEHGEALTSAFKKLIKARNLKVKMRAQRTGCMETCELGPSVVIYPEGVFYGHVQLEDVEEIVTEHLENNRIVQRLVMDFSKLPNR